MNMPSQNYFIVITKESPFEYQSDFRMPKLIANDKIQYYRTGDLTTNIKDAYKWESEEDAIDFINKNLNGNDKYEVRQLNIAYEII